MVEAVVVPLLMVLPTASCSPGSWSSCAASAWATRATTRSIRLAVVGLCRGRSLACLLALPARYLATAVLLGCDLPARHGRADVAAVGCSAGN